MQKRRIVSDQQYQAIPLHADFPLSYEQTFLNDESEVGPWLHVHDLLELGLCLSGTGVFSVRGRVWSFQPGDFAVVAPYEPHWAQGNRGVRSEWVWFFFDPLRLLGARAGALELLDASRLAGPDFDHVLSGVEHPFLARLCIEIHRELQEEGVHHREAIRGLLLALLTQLQRLPNCGHGGGARAVEAIRRLMPALQRIQIAYDETLQVRELSSLCHMSESSFRENFRRVMACSPYQYLNRYRISLASAELLRGELSVEEIALAHGFPTLSCFVRQFGAQKGMAPRAWARQV